MLPISSPLVPSEILEQTHLQPEMQWSEPINDVARVPWDSNSPHYPLARLNYERVSSHRNGPWSAEHFMIYKLLPCTL